MIIKEIAKFITNFKYENIPINVIDKTKLAFVDYLGVTTRGFNEKSTQIAIKTLNEFNEIELKKTENKKSSIIGGLYSNSLNAGFINGISSHSLDLDDGHRIAQLHPGSVVFSTALAISEAENLNGREFLEAVVCGYEIAIVLGMIANPEHRNQGFHSTGTIGTFASGVATSKLLKLDFDQTIATLGLCGTQSSGLLESDHKATMGKHLHSGKAVYNGILSSYLAKNEFSGAESIFDGEEGFLKSMAFESKFNDIKDIYKFLEENLGKFHIKDVYFKKYPVCRHLHSSIDSILLLRKEIIAEYNKIHKNSHKVPDFHIDFIKKIHIITYKIASNHDNFNLKNHEEIKQSLPYTIAISLLFGDLNLDIIKKSNIKDERIEKILNKIAISEDKNFTKMFPKMRPSKIIVELNLGKNTKKLEKIVYLPLGESENPFSKEDIFNKFKNLNPKKDVNKLLAIEDIENNKIREIISFLN